MCFLRYGKILFSSGKPGSKGIIKFQKSGHPVIVICQLPSLVPQNRSSTRVPSLIAAMIVDKVKPQMT